MIFYGIFMCGDGVGGIVVKVLFIFWYLLIGVVLYVEGIEYYVRRRDLYVFVVWLKFG